MMEQKSDILFVFDMVRELEESGRFSELRAYTAHSDVSVYAHSIAVASISLRLARLSGLRVDIRSLVRGALLHDYYLYDWHIPSPNRHLHGIYHPMVAASNAFRDYHINPREFNIICAHMFPLPPTRLPLCTEAWLVVIADKIAASAEVLWCLPMNII